MYFSSINRDLFFLSETDSDEVSLNDNVLIRNDALSQIIMMNTLIIQLQITFVHYNNNFIQKIKTYLQLQYNIWYSKYTIYAYVI